MVSIGVIQTLLEMDGDPIMDIVALDVNMQQSKQKEKRRQYANKSGKHVDKDSPKLRLRVVSVPNS